MQLGSKIAIGGFLVVLVLVTLVVLYSESLFHVNKYRIRAIAYNLLLVLCMYTALTIMTCILFELVG